MRAPFAAGALGPVALVSVRPAAQGSVEILTNDTIIRMVAGRVDRRTVQARIRSTRNSFDVTPEGLVRLYENRVVPDIISAMLAVSEQPQDTLTNESVIYMVTNRLPRSLIIQKIRTAGSAFDLTATGLAALSQRKVPSDIVTIMMASSPARAGPGLILATAEITPATVAPATVAPVTVLAPTVSPATAAPSAVVPITAATPFASTVEPTSVDPVTVPPATVPPPTVNTPVAAVPGGRATASSSIKVADGAPAVLRVQLTANAAIDKVVEYFDSRHIGFTLALEATMLVSDWFDERGCSPRFRCANRATVRATGAGAETLIAVQVFERRRETVTSPRPWIENPTSQGKDTADIARALEASLAK